MMRAWPRFAMAVVTGVAGTTFFAVGSGSAEQTTGVAPAEIGPPVDLGRPPGADGGKPVSGDWLVDAGHARSDLTRPVVDWLPDGRHLLAGNKGSVEVVDTADGSVRELAEGDSPVLSPDARRVAYSSGGQVWWVPVKGGEPREVTSTKAPVEAFTWTSDGDSVAYVTSRTTPPPKLSETADVTDVSVSATTRSTLRLKPLGGEARKLWSFRGNSIHLLAVPERDAVLVQPYHGYDNTAEVVTEVYTVTTRGKAKATRLLSGLGGQVYGLSPSPDGETVAFQYAVDDTAAFPAFLDVGTVPTDGGRPTRVSTGVYSVGPPEWSRDGTLYFRCKERVFVTACAVPAQTGEPARPRVLWPDHGGDISALAVSPDGGRLAWQLSDSYGGSRTESAPVRAGAEDGEVTTVDVTERAPRNRALGTFHQVTWHGRDGLRLSGALLLPPGYREGQRLPMVVDVHGGAQGGVGVSQGGALTTSTPLEWQVWAAKGYAVFLVDYRSGVITGWDAVEEARRAGDWLERDAYDVITGTRALVQAGVADPRRLGMIGHSAGGLTGNGVIVHSSLFRAAVLHEGWAEEFYLSAQNNPGHGSTNINDWQFGGPPWDRSLRQRYIANSPTYFADRVTTPTLYAAGSEALGDDDFSGYQMITAMRRRGVDAQYLVYEGEDHVFAKPPNQKDYITRATAWIDDRIG